MKLSPAPLLIALAALLQACASPVQQTVERPVSEPVVTAKAIAPNADELVTKAKNTYLATGDINKRNHWLLAAAEAYVQESNPQASIKLLQLLLPELQGQQQASANLLLAEAYLQTAPGTEVKALSALLAQITPAQLEKEIKRQRFYQLQMQFEQTQGNWLQAAQAALKTGMPAEQSVAEIWQLIQNLSAEQLQQARLKYTDLQPWLQLALIKHQYGLAPESLQQAIMDWQNRHPQHALSQQLPTELLQAKQSGIFAPTKIAVLLPLSGRLRSQGEAIKEGILAGYFASLVESSDMSSAVQVEYLDTASLSTNELLQRMQDADAIIGPLLKQKMTELLPLLPSGKPILALNQLESNERSYTLADAYYFALSPENEAKQLAEFVYARGHQYPTILSNGTNVAERMSEAFLSQWRELYPDMHKGAMLTTFSDNKDMRSKVSERLDVKQSQSRIRSIERLLTEELHSVPRNRQDIDAIVVFADPEQTQLLNPMIESSISPFSANKIPVYASSRSHKYRLNSTGYRDLRNLTFSDMPWMLPNQQWSELKSETLKLWQNRPDTQLRLFALGYDAYQLLPHLSQLKLLSGLSVDAMSGVLSVTTNGVIQRQLSYGRVSETRVDILAMD